MSVTQDLRKTARGSARDFHLLACRCSSRTHSPTEPQRWVISPMRTPRRCFPLVIPPTYPLTTWIRHNHKPQHFVEYLEQDDR
jgi:hypothetical protein